MQVNQGGRDFIGTTFAYGTILYKGGTKEALLRGLGQGGIDISLFLAIKRNAYLV